MSSKDHSNAIRFAVGTPQNVQSSVWRMWVHRNEVYIGARDSLKVFKVSLHNSGIWRIAFIAELEREDADSDRVIVRWKRPNEFVPGWTPSIDILVSSIHAQQPFEPLPINDARIHWVTPPKDGQKLLFKMLFSSPGFSEEHLAKVMLEQDRLVTRMVKDNGEVVWLVVREEELSPVEIEKNQDVMIKTKIYLKPDSSEESISDSRALLVVSDNVPTVSTQPTILDIPLGKENVVIA